MAEKRSHVLEALDAIQIALASQGIAKDRKNEGQGFKFRGIDQVLTALSAQLASNHVQLAPNVTELRTENRETKSGGKMYVSVLKMELFATSTIDGSRHHLATTWGEGADSGDKATSKALSAAFKYGAFLGFCIPLEGVLDDADFDNPAEAPSSPSKASKKSEATNAPAKEEKAAEEPTAPAKGKSKKADKPAPETDTIGDALKRIEECSELEMADALALELRSLKSHERFGEIKTAMTAKLKSLR